jgi:hypothetical protein
MINPANSQLIIAPDPACEMVNPDNEKIALPIIPPTANNPPFKTFIDIFVSLAVAPDQI